MLHKCRNFRDLGDTKMQCVSLKIKVFFDLKEDPESRLGENALIIASPLTSYLFFSSSSSFFFRPLIEWHLREEEEKEGNLVKAPSSPVVAKIPKEGGGGGAFVLGGSVPLMMLPCSLWVWAPLER